MGCVCNIKILDFIQNKFFCSVGSLVSQSLSVLLPGLQKGPSTMPSFSVSQVECQGSCREISSSFLRHTPENNDAKIPPSYRAGALQGASLPKLLRFLLPPAEQQKKSLQSNTLPIPQEQRVQGEPGKLAMKFHFFLLTQRGYHQRTDFFFFIFRGDPRESCQAELEPGLEGSHL